MGKPKTTIKKCSFNFTKESLRQLDELCLDFGENATQVVSRAIQALHYSLRIDGVSLLDVKDKPRKKRNESNDV